MAEFYSATIRLSDRFSGPVLRRDLHKAKMEAKIREILAQGHGIRKTAKLAGAGVGTVHRIKRSLKAEVT